MERLFHRHDQESPTPIEKQFKDLSEYFQMTSEPTLQKLDEYLVVVAQFYQQEARKGGEAHEEAYLSVRKLEKVQNGNYLQEKRLFCLASQTTALTFAERFEKEGKVESARRSRVETNNWLKLADICQRQKPENKSCWKKNRFLINDNLTHRPHSD